MPMATRPARARAPSSAFIVAPAPVLEEVAVAVPAAPPRVPVVEVMVVVTGVFTTDVKVLSRVAMVDAEIVSVVEPLVIVVAELTWKRVSTPVLVDPGITLVITVVPEAAAETAALAIEEDSDATMLLMTAAVDDEAAAAAEVIALLRPASVDD